MRWLTMACLLVACSAFEPPGATSFTPPASYRVWWDSMQVCTGHTGSFGRVQWFTVPGASFEGPDGKEIIGRWEPPHTIFLAESLVAVPWLVKHEMIHDLLGRPGHPREIFLDACKLPSFAI